MISGVVFPGFWAICSFFQIFWSGGTGAAPVNGLLSQDSLLYIYKKLGVGISWGAIFSDFSSIFMALGQRRAVPSICYSGPNLSLTDNGDFFQFFDQIWDITLFSIVLSDKTCRLPDMLCPHYVWVTKTCCLGNTPQK